MVNQPYGKLRTLSARQTICQKTRGTCLGMTAVIRRAEAVLQALIMMRSSIRPSLISPGAVLCKMKTSRIRQRGCGKKRGRKHTIFVSNTNSVYQQMAREFEAQGCIAYLSPIVTDVSLFEYCRTSTLVSRRGSIN